MTIRYATIERIAVGGMGEVFLARQESMGGFRRTVVLKRLLPDMEGDDDILKRFLDEARVAGVLSHENVVSILEVSEDQTGPYLALEYIHGENAGTLRTRARKQKISIPVVVVARIVADAARGLAHAHEAHDVEGRALHIVHRDVAPKNIFVRTDGVSKIGDFGIAKSAHQLARTATGQVPGTLSYMSPEQARGDSIGAASDQFSLGIVLWELLTAGVLFKAESPQETLRNILQKKIPAPSTKRPEAAPLDAIALKMLDRDPKKRFATLADAAAALEAALPETRAELGQRAVAAFVEAIAGNELRERMARIEDGSDQTAMSPRPPTMTGGSTPAGGASASSASSSPSSSGASSGSSSGSQESSADAKTTNARIRGTSPSGATATPATGLVDATLPAGMLAPIAPREARRLPVAAALTAVVGVVVVAAGGFAWTHRTPTAAERTRAYLQGAVGKNALIDHEIFLALADDAHVESATALATADALAALVDERLTLLERQARRSERERDAHQQEVADAERALETRARAALKVLHNDELAVQALDMWDYDSGAPQKWLPPEEPAALLDELKDGTVEYMKAGAPTRVRAVDRLLARSHQVSPSVDPSAVHAFLDPLVLEREQLIERATTVSPQALPAISQRIDALRRQGEHRLEDLCGPHLGGAIADVAFFSVAGTSEWQPQFGMQPSVRDQKAGGGTAPETH